MRINTRRFLNLNRLTNFSLAGYNKAHEIYYKVEPYNLNVLSDDSIISKIDALTNIIKGVGKFEIICLNGKENFEENKLYYQQLIKEEDSPIIKKIIKQELKLLYEIQSNTATSRSFLIGMRLKEEKGFNIETYLANIEKSLTNNGLNIQRVDKDNLKEILAVYYANMVLFDHYEDVEGEWYERN